MKQASYVSRIMEERKPGLFKQIFAAFSDTYEEATEVYKKLPIPKRRFLRLKTQLCDGSLIHQDVHPPTAVPPKIPPHIKHASVLTSVRV